jgi:hypothetical protein
MAHFTVPDITPATVHLNKVLRLDNCCLANLITYLLVISARAISGPNPFVWSVLSTFLSLDAAGVFLIFP